jgi:tripartite-type tricarboxylate transporter receptor subunit TctC
MFDGLGSSAAHIKGGRLRAIAVAADKPAPGFPEIPLAKAGGAPDYVVATWYGLWAPKGTPRDIVDKMAAEMRKALNRTSCAPPGPASAPRRPTSTATPSASSSRPRSSAGPRS